MARTAALSKEQIMAATFDLMDREGPEAITIRAIAAALGKSTAPIYTQYESREQVMADLRIYTLEHLHNSTQQQRTADGFLNIGLGVIAFALEHRRVFHYHFLTGDKPPMEHLNREDHYIAQMKQGGMLGLFEDERLKVLLDDMWVYTMGLTALICTDTDANKDLNYYQTKLQAMGSRQIQYHLYSSGKMEEWTQLFLSKVTKHLSLEEVFNS